jgi:hypothetical protein
MLFKRPNRGVRPSESRKLQRAESLDRQISGIVGKVGSRKGVAPGEKPSSPLGEWTRLSRGLFEAGPQLVQEWRPLTV